MAAGATFCLQCGQMYATVGPTGALVAKKQRNAVLLSIAVVITVLAAFAGMAASGLIKIGGAAPPPGLSAKAGATDSMLTRPGDEPEAMLTRPAEEKAPALVESGPISMPADVRAWLEHLERIEKKKNDLHVDQSDTAKMAAKMLEGAGGITSIEDVNTLTDPDAAMPDMRGDVTAMFEELKQPWVALRAEFQRGPRVPAECAGLAATYSAALANIPSTIDQLTGIVSGFNPQDSNAQSLAERARSAARGVGRNHKGSVDGSFSQADELLETICEKYNTRKWFDIHSGRLGGGGFVR